jgi:DNA-binding transcriptional LysR family regulator
VQSPGCSPCQAPRPALERTPLPLAAPGRLQQPLALQRPRRLRNIVTVHSRLTSSNAVALKACALVGMVVILQAHWIVGRELRNHCLIDLFSDLEVSTVVSESPVVWLVYPTRAYLPLKVRVFLEFVRERFRGGLRWDETRI